MAGSLRFHLSEVVDELRVGGFVEEALDFPEMKLLGFSSIHELQHDTVSWIGTDKFSRIELLRAVILCGRQCTPPRSSETIFLPVSNPRLAFASLLRRFVPVISPKPGIHATAVVDDSVQLGENVHIGEFSLLRGNIRIGDRTIIHDHVTIVGDVAVGSDCVLQAGVVVGEPGFGFVKDDRTNHWVRFPHVGGIVIGDDVEIGANSCIDRAAMGNTTIGSGTKIDNCVHVAHGAHVGTDCVLTAGTVISGSAEIGDHVWFGPNSCVLNKVVIENDVTVGIGAVVISRVRSGRTVFGNPASRTRNTQNR